MTMIIYIATRSVLKSLGVIALVRCVGTGALFLVDDGSLGVGENWKSPVFLMLFAFQ